MGRTKSTIAPVKPKKCVRKKYGVYDKQLLFNVIEKYKPTGVLLWQQVAEEYRERRGDVHTRPPQVIETYFYTHLCKTMGKNAWTNDKDQFTKDCRSLFDRIAKYHGARNIGSSDSEEESNSEEGADSEGDSGDSEDECDGWGADVWDEEFDDFDEEFGDWDEEESSDQNEECGGREEEEDFDEEESIDSDESMDEDNPEAIKKGSPDDIRRRILRNCDEVRRNLEKEYGKLDSKSNARTSQTVRPDREVSPIILYPFYRLFIRYLR